jgi:formamidopyrimidine-DNA glycosylase
MPELPEVERARALIADRALNRRIVAVDDADTYVCRPHAPGEIADALVGRMLVTAERRGKTMWCETSDDGPTLGCTSAWRGGSSSTTTRRATAARVRSGSSGTASR